MHDAMPDPRLGAKTWTRVIQSKPGDLKGYWHALACIGAFLATTNFNDCSVVGQFEMSVHGQ
jgi:hypothetical protein